MQTALETKRNIRISKKSLAAFPPEVSAAILRIQDDHPNIKSFSFTTVLPTHTFYADEGIEYTVIYSDSVSSVEMVAEHNLGAANVSHRIGDGFTCKVGAFVLRVGYYAKYFLDIYNVQPEQLPAPAPVEPVAEVPAKPAPVTAPSHYTPKEGRVTPLRRQYLDIKAQYPDSILLFRLGDFYETFDYDAEIFSRVCDLVLTSRPISKTERIPMAGVPHHAVNQYIEQLLKAGHHVAICEQTSEPSWNGVVDRAVTKTYKPTPAEVTPAAPVEDAPVANEPEAAAVDEPVASEPVANDTINDTVAPEDDLANTKLALGIAQNENAKLTSQLEALRAWYGEMKTRRDIDIAQLLDTINDLQEERDTLMARVTELETGSNL